jgi:cation transport regulator
MPYRRIEDLPDRIKKNLSGDPQKIFREVYDNSWKQYFSPEKRRGEADPGEAANKVAWSAVKKKYKKIIMETG